MQLNNVVSRKTHGTAGDFDITLFDAAALCGPGPCPRGVECRSGGANGDYTLFLKFNCALAIVGPASASESGCGTIAVSGSSCSGDTCTVQLTGVCNADYVTVTLTDVNDSCGDHSDSVSTEMGVLLGDTTGNGSVNASDISQTKGQSGTVASSSNFRNDVTVNGSINSSDISSVKSKSGTALPTPP